MEQRPTASDRLAIVMVLSIDDTVASDLKKRERVPKGGGRNEGMMVWKSLARPNRQKLWENHNNGVAIVTLAISIGPVQPLHRSFHGVGVLVAGASAFPSRRGPRDLLRLHGVNREVEAGHVILTNKGGKKPNGDQEVLADGVREATDDPLDIAINMLADDGAGEEAERAIPTTKELGAVGRIRPHLGSLGSANALSQRSLKESRLGRVRHCRKGEVLGVATFTTTNG